MGLKGNLSTVNLADVFQVLSRGNSTGLLRIQAPEGPRFVEIQNGAISVAGRSSGRIMLGDLLISRGLLDEDRLDQALQNQRETQKMLGQVLLDMGLVTMESLEQALHFQIEEEVCELFTLGKGDFDFLAGAALDAKIAPGGGLVRLKIDPNSLLLEAARRADEWKAIEQRIPNQGFLFRLSAEGSKILGSGEGLSAEGLVLLKLVQESRTIESMVQKACLGRLNTNQMLIELWDAGLIEPMPVSSYEKAARSHLKLKRVDEAERVASFAAEYGDKDERALATAMLKEVATAKKAAQSQTNMAATTDPRVRSEVIRRNAPNLILKKERSKLPFIIVGGLVAVLVGGYFGYAFVFGAKGVNAEERKRFNTSYDGAEAALSRKEYSVALDGLRMFHSPSDPETEKLARDKYEKLRAQVISELRRAIDAFNTAQAKGTAAEKDAAAADLNRFSNVGPLSPDVDSEYAKVQAAVKEYAEKLQLESSKARLKEIIASSKGKTFDELNNVWQSFLKENPPEETASGARDQLGLLLKQRAEAEKRLKQAEAAKAGGDTESARQLLNLVKRDGPGSEYSAKGEAGLAALDKYLNDEAARLDKIEILLAQKQTDDAKAEITKFLDEHPPQGLLARAISILQSMVNDPDELTSEFAAIKGQHDSPEGRRKLVELLQKAPYSKAATMEVLSIKVTSEPAGADVVFNGHSAGKTPCNVDVPALGMAHFTIKKTGYSTEDVFDYNCRKDSLSVSLSRTPAHTRRLPQPAKGGLAVDGEHAVAVTGEEAIFCAQADLKIEVRVPLRSDPAQKPDAITEEFNSVVMTPGYVLMASSDKALCLIRYSSTAREYSRIVLIQPGAFPTLMFKTRQVPGKRLAALPTEHGYSCVAIEDGQVLVGYAFPETEKDKPTGVVSHEEWCYIAHGEVLTALAGHSAVRKWDVPTEAPIVGSPACIGNRNMIAVVNSAGRLFVFDTDKGTKRFHHDLPSPPATGLLSMPNGFITLLKNGKAELYSYDQGNTVWSSNVPGEMVAPPVIVRPPNERDPEKSIVFCSHDKDGYLVTLLNITSGATIWRARFTAKPLAMAAGNDRVYVATDDLDLSVFDAKD